MMVHLLSFIVVIGDVSVAVASPAVPGRACLSLFHLLSTVFLVVDLPLSAGVAYFISLVCGEFGQSFDAIASE